MERNLLNLYLDPLMQISDLELKEARRKLIELAYELENIEDLLPEWMWMNQAGEDLSLRVMLWFGLGYDQLAEIFGYSIKEIRQLIRSQRVAELGRYPALGHKSQDFGGISCFMVEQNLSAWMDSEWEDLAGVQAMQAHLKDCNACRDRLMEYRKLQEKIISEKRTHPEIEKTEWDEAVGVLKQRIRTRRAQYAVIGLIFVSIVGLTIWVLESQPDEMPNVYRYEVEEEG